LTFFDDSNNTILNWLREWINTTILNNGQYVSVLEDSIKPVQILKLNQQRDIIQTTSYYVFPEGQIVYNGDSDSSPQQYSVNFVITGRGGN
jgi:hypothetical protein